MYGHTPCERNKEKQRKNMNQNAIGPLLTHLNSMLIRFNNMACHQFSVCLQIFIETVKNFM